MTNYDFTSATLKEDLMHFLKEDDLSRNFYYMSRLPNDLVRCSLKFKSDMVVAGLPYFFEVFKTLGAQELDWRDFQQLEGSSINQSEINFDLPFAVALTGERIAINLLQHGSSIATFTSKFVEKTKKYNIAILDTRKTTPGLRSLEKYSVRTGGGYNHRLGQTDLWMIKDNHKTFFGGVKEAIDFFRSMQGFYTPIEVEIHDLPELKEAIDMGIKHVMLDNFSPEDVRKAVEIKPADVTYEISGGITLETVDKYLIEGVDAISVGALTYGAPSVDISLKYKRV